VLPNSLLANYKDDDDDNNNTNNNNNSTNGTVPLVLSKAPVLYKNMNVQARRQASLTVFQDLQCLGCCKVFSFQEQFLNSNHFSANSSGHAVEGVGLRPLACWDSEFKPRAGHGCLSVVNFESC
jgi:hypothetical protein